MMMETSQMVRQRYSLLLVSIPCKIFVLVDVRAVGAELQPAVVAAARMSAACGNVRAVVATSALANQQLL
jgi:hypothetical protein